MAWIGNSDKHAIIAESVARMSLRIHDVPEFHFYAIADSARSILSRSPRLLQPDFHLPRCQNRNFALCLQGFGDFSP